MLDTSTNNIQDCIRGCLMAGAAGDALGYQIEFRSHNAILNIYGDKDYFDK
jgi:ADP-ribosylglycohydrolase